MQLACSQLHEQTEPDLENLGFEVVAAIFLVQALESQSVVCECLFSHQYHHGRSSNDRA